MTPLVTNLYWQLRRIIVREDGQDLAEYALVFALISFGAVAGMDAVAAGINNAFSDVAATFTSNIT
jgi:Flp pilus assembly pilin Flp